MGLHQFTPPMSGRMGTLKTLATIRDAALIEYGCMGHLLYGRVFLNQAGVWEGCKLYSTHIDEADISLGDTGRLARSIAEVAGRDQPRVIFLLPSAVPTIIGTDLPAICRELQPEYPDVPLIPFGCGGFNEHGYRGVQEALLLLARTLPRAMERTRRPTYNIIGSCADMFRFHADAGELQRVLKGAFGMEAICVMTSGTSVTQLEQLSSAHVNLVIRREGVPAAEHLQKRFGTPYLFGRPYGIEGTVKWLHAVKELIGLDPNHAFIKEEASRANAQMEPAEPVFRHVRRSHPDEATLSIGGHADVVEGVLRYATQELSLNQGICWCDCPEMASASVPYYSEEAWTSAITAQRKGMVMAGGEALVWAGKSPELQLANPDVKWRLSPYEAPFVGFRGAVHLAGLWLNAVLEQE